MNGSIKVILFLVIISLASCMQMPFEPLKNQPPDTPTVEINTHNIPAHLNLELNIDSRDPDNDKVCFQVKMQDLEDPSSEALYTNWTSFFPSGHTIGLALHNSSGSFSISLRSRDDRHAMSEFSDTLNVFFHSIPPTITSSDTVMYHHPAEGDYVITTDTDNESGAMVRVNPGDGTAISEWVATSYDNGAYRTHYIHEFASPGVFLMRAQTRFIDGTLSAWSEPFRVSILTQLPLISTLNLGTEVSDFLVTHNYAYVLGVNGTCPVSLQDPAHPVQGTSFGPGQVTHIVANTQFIYIYDHQNGEKSYSLSNPAIPHLMGTFNNGAYLSAMDDDMAMFHDPDVVNGSYYLLRSYTYRGIQFTEQGSIYPSEFYGYQSVINWPFAYVLATDNSTERLYVVNISTPEALGVWNVLELGNSSHYKMCLGQGYLLLTNQSELSMYSLISGYGPARFYHADVNGTPVGVNYGNGYFAIARNNENGGNIQLLKVDYSSHVSEQGNYDFTTDVKGVWAGDNYLYATAADNRFYTIGYPNTRGISPLPRKKQPFLEALRLRK